MPGSPPDIHQQRLRHLFAGAILELWKKETGSVTSVLIEGTVCVTVHGGRTTVVQLCERFAGLVNGDCDSPPTSASVDVGSLRQSDHGGHLYVAPTCTPSTKSRGCRAATTERTKDTNNNLRSAGTPRDVLTVPAPAISDDSDDDDEERSLVEDDEDIDDDDHSSSMLVDDDEAAAMQNVSGGTGSFSPDAGKSSGTKLNGEDDSSADDSAIHDMSLNRTSNSLQGAAADDSVVVVGQSPRRKTPSKTPAASSNGAGAGGGNDLLLSSPHDYTAQVRNVIRQRLLNASGKHLSASSSRGQISANNNTVAAAVVSDVRLQSSPYYRPTAAVPGVESTPPSLWIKRETPSAAASEAMATAARRLASQYAAAAAGHIPMTLMSPPGPLAMPVGLPIPGVPLNASLHNLLGMKSPVPPPPGAAAMLMSGTGASPRIAPLTPDSKRAGCSTALGVELTAGTSGGDPNQASAGGEQKIYRCDYCNKTFLFKSKYHEHLPVHTSARPFQCHLCTRTYKYKYDLRVHLRTHLGIPTKSTVCPFCAARFATNKFLRQHMRDTHSDQKATAPLPGGSSEPPGAVETFAAGADAEMTSSSQDFDAEPNKDDDLTSRPPESDLLLDDCCSDATADDAAVLPLSAAAATDVTPAAGQNDL